MVKETVDLRFLLQDVMATFWYENCSVFPPFRYKKQSLRRNFHNNPPQLRSIAQMYIAIIFIRYYHSMECYVSQCGDENTP